PDTPSAIIRRCTWQDQSVIRCKLGEVAEQLTPASKMRPPVIVIVGDVSQLGENFDWFSTKPLHGLGVLHTRPEPDAELTRSLRDLGAEVFHQPAVELVPPADMSSLDGALGQLNAAPAIDGITFSSINGVDGFMSRLLDRGLDARALAGCKLACVGASTAERLGKFGLKADIVPESPKDYSAAGLLKKLDDHQLQDQRWIVTTTNRSQGELQAGLAAAGASVLEAMSYETRPVTELRPAVSQALSKNRIQVCTLTSPAIAEATYELLGEHTRYIAPVAFSPVIAHNLNLLGWTCEQIAATRNRPGLLAAVERCWVTREAT
ncbi:MAG: uroporphyrinogen-III synthase, partial [Planctomycetota bacterium]